MLRVSAGQRDIAPWLALHRPARFGRHSPSEFTPTALALPMDALLNLITAVQDLFFSLVNIVGSLFALILPWTPLIAWIAFWLLAVNWVKLRATFLRGGWVGFLLLAFVMILVWGAVAPPAAGAHNLLGLKLSNYVGKTVYVTFLFCIILLCGSVQLSGAVRPVFPDEEPEGETAAHH